MIGATSDCMRYWVENSRGSSALSTFERDGLGAMRDPDDLFAALQRSEFRRRFRLGPKDRAYLEEKSMPVILQHGRRFLVERLAPAQASNDGKQTPMRGHPIFLAQHATATCCRRCLKKWHRIEPDLPLTGEQVDYLLAVIERWLSGQISLGDAAGQAPKSKQRQLTWFETD